jgi:hypothetical protein
MMEKKIKLLLRKNLILDFNDYYEEYFDDYYFRETNMVSRIKTFVKALFRIGR